MPAVRLEDRRVRGWSWLSIALVVALLNCQRVQGQGMDIETWWHSNSELNGSTAVEAGNIRRSTIYDVRIATVAAADVLHDSFTYMSLPRSGRGKEGYDEKDGAEFAANANMTMSWTTFLYRADAWVYVEIKEGPPLGSPDEVTIRPTTLDLHKELVNERTLRILVPYSTLGFRFSVEFNSEQLTIYKDSNSGDLTTSAAGNRAVHTQPRNALMIFAEPMPVGADVDRLVPNPARQSIYYPEEGSVTYLHTVNEEVIYFRPGTYYMGGDYHATLRSGVRWIYLAPGAYVKGAFQFLKGPTEFKVTGYGILSGEQYVYEPDRTNGYRHRAPGVEDCHNTCIKMLEFESGPEQQQLTMHGITLANPPYHAFTVYGQERRFAIHAAQMKQIGAWYWQTDSLELYEGSSLEHSFLHANDDVMKLYARHLQVIDIVVWKEENGPVIQWGWSPKTINDVHVTGVDVIHNRMHRDSHNSCIINSARHYLDPDSSRLADPNEHVTDVFIENIRSEGMNLCAMRLYALSSWENIEIQNLWIEAWNELDTATQASKFEALSNAAGERVFIGNEVRGRRGLSIVNYVVGTERIAKAAENWRSNQTGRLDFEASLWENWDAR
jgi:hypothetical protein